MNNELERIWKVDHEIISQKLAGGPEEKDKQPVSESRPQHEIPRINNRRASYSIVTFDYVLI
jgi:hypothetical protein